MFPHQKTDQRLPRRIFQRHHDARASPPFPLREHELKLRELRGRRLYILLGASGSQLLQEPGGSGGVEPFAPFFKPPSGSLAAQGGLAVKPLGGDTRHGAGVKREKRHLLLRGAPLHQSSRLPLAGKRKHTSGNRCQGQQQGQQLGTHACLQYRLPRRFETKNARQKARVCNSRHERYALPPFPMDKDYKVKLEVFEGPLDLLLYLIKRDEIDIYDIPIEHITRQYLEYLDAFKVLDLDVAGEFVVMAANLIYIKSRSLLPVHQQPPEEGAEEEDPRLELVRQLLEYKKFKDAAAHLGEREAVQSALYTRLPEAPELTGERPMAEVSIFDLINAFQKVLKKVNQKEDLREIFEESFTVSEKIDFVLKMTGSGSALRFTDLFTHVASRAEIVVTFLALLELIRLKQVRVTQAEPFAEIELARVHQAPPTDAAQGSH